MTAQHALPPLQTPPPHRPLHLAQSPQPNIKTRSSSRGSFSTASSSSSSSSSSQHTKQPARAVSPSPPSSSYPPPLRRRLRSSMASSKPPSSSTSSSSSSSSTASPHRKPKKASSSTTTGKGGGLLTSGYFYMALLALQYGMQPIIVRAFIPKSTPKMPIVMATEAVKILLCAVGLIATESKSARDKMWATWTFRQATRPPSLPASLTPSLPSFLLHSFPTALHSTHLLTPRLSL